MAIRGDRIWRGPRALALGLAFLAGCGQFPRHRPASPVSGILGGGGPTPRITTRQAADVDVALGRSLEDQGDAERAEAAYREALKKDPSRADALVRLAILHDQRSKFKESADLYGQALAVRPDDPEILCDRGYSYYVQRRWVEAEADLRQALRRKPDLARAHNNLGLVLARDSREDEALAEFRRAGCDVADAHANLGLALALDGRWLEARQHYGVALTAKPNSESAREGSRVMTAMLTRHDPAIARAGATVARPAPRARAAQ